MLIFRLAFRNIFRHRFRSIVTLFSIAFGSIVLIFLSGYFENTFSQMRESYINWRTGHLQLATRGFFEHAQEDPFKYMIDNPDELLREIRSWPEVKWASPRMKFSGLISTRENSIPCEIEAMEPFPFSTKGKTWLAALPEIKNLEVSDVIINAGGKSLNNESRYDLIVGQGLSKALGNKVGDPVTLMGVTREGGLNALDLNTKGIFGTSAKAYDDHFIRIPVTTAQELLNTNSIHYLFILLNDTKLTPLVEQRLMKYVKEKNLNLEMRNWRQLNSFYTKTEQLFKRIFLILKLIVSLIIILSITNTMNMVVNERIVEIGTLRSLGTKKGNIIKIFIVEGLLLGLMGGLIGAVAGALITGTVQKIGIIMPPPPGMMYRWILEPAILPGAILFSFILSLITAVLASLWPSWKAAQMDIAESLRYNN